MMFAIRKKGTEEYYQEDGNWGPVDTALIYEDRLNAEAQCCTTEEVVKVKLVLDDD